MYGIEELRIILIRSKTVEEWNEFMKTELLKSRTLLLKEEFEQFRRKIEKYKYISLFGVGRYAEHWGYEFVCEWCEDKIVCFSDNNSEMWGKTIVDNLKCVSPTELMKYREDMICIILVSKEKQDEIIMQLKKQGIDSIIIKKEWLYIDDLMEKYLGIKLPDIWAGNAELGNYNKVVDEKKRIAVFTCIIGGYDDLQQPLVKDSKCDYFYLGLERPKDLGVYQWIDISDKIPEYIKGDFTRINRYCKLHPHVFFPHYDYSIYIDGKILIHTELFHLLIKIGKIGIASYKMPFAEDIYEHAIGAYFRNGYGEENGKERIKNQMQRYAKEGFPRYFGFTENGVMVREHMNCNCIQIMETWWSEILNYSRRDQLSFMYAVWKNGFLPEDVGYIDETFRKGPEFSIIPSHNKDYSNAKKFNRF